MRMFAAISPQVLLRIMLASLLLLVLYYGWNGILPHQLTWSPLFDISLDNTFWIYHLTGFPAWMNDNRWVSIILEIVFIGLAVWLFYRHQPAVGVFFLLVMIALSLYMQSYSCVLTKISVILPIVFFPFCFKGELLHYTRRFTRYYLVYLMVSAALFKMINGGLFHAGQMEAILWNQHTDLALHGSNHISGVLSGWLGSSRILAWSTYFIIFLVELSFVALLFTRKYDKAFIVVLILFCALIYMVMRINTVEMLFLSFPLIQISMDNDYF